MPSVQKEIEELRTLLAKGRLQKAYRALHAYIRELRAHFNHNLADCTVSGLYQGYLDGTFFALFPSSLRRHQLKIAVVFNYDAFRFEVWLAAVNREVQRKYWRLLKDHDWPNCRVSTPGKGVDSILECDLTSDIDLDHPEALTVNIERGTVAFLRDIEQFLEKAPRSR